jgi:dCTP diphosphatase
MKNLMASINLFIEKRGWSQFHSPKNLSMALGIEVAEMQEHFQWLTQDESKNLSDEKLQYVKEEIGDVFIYLIRICQVLGIDPIKAANEKMILNEQKYPVEKSKGNFKKYTEL